MSHARIGRIRMKNGGADVRVLYPKQKEDGLPTLLKEDVATLTRGPRGRVTGFAVVVVYEDKTRDMAWAITEDCAVPDTLWPAYVAECLRAQIVTGSEVQDILNGDGP